MTQVSHSTSELLNFNLPPPSPTDSSSSTMSNGHSAKLKTSIDSNTIFPTIEEADESCTAYATLEQNPNPKLQEFFKTTEYESIYQYTAPVHASQIQNQSISPVKIARVQTEKTVPKNRCQFQNGQFLPPALPPNLPQTESDTSLTDSKIFSRPDSMPTSDFMSVTNMSVTSKQILASSLPVDPITAIQDHVTCPSARTSATLISNKQIFEKPAPVAEVETETKIDLTEVSDSFFTEFQSKKSAGEAEVQQEKCLAIVETQSTVEGDGHVSIEITENATSTEVQSICRVISPEVPKKNPVRFVPRVAEKNLKNSNQTVTGTKFPNGQNFPGLGHRSQTLSNILKLPLSKQKSRSLTSLNQTDQEMERLELIKHHNDFIDKRAELKQLKSAHMLQQYSESVYRQKKSLDLEKNLNQRKPPASSSNSGHPQIYQEIYDTKTILKKMNRNSNISHKLFTGHEKQERLPAHFVINVKKRPLSKTRSKSVSNLATEAMIRTKSSPLLKALAIEPKFNREVSKEKIERVEKVGKSPQHKKMAGLKLTRKPNISNPNPISSSTLAVDKKKPRERKFSREIIKNLCSSPKEVKLDQISGFYVSGSQLSNLSKIRLLKKEYLRSHSGMGKSSSGGMTMFNCHK